MRWRIHRSWDFILRPDLFIARPNTNSESEWDSRYLSRTQRPLNNLAPIRPLHSALDPKTTLMPQQIQRRSPLGCPISMFHHRLHVRLIFNYAKIKDKKYFSFNKIKGANWENWVKSGALRPPCEWWNCAPNWIGQKWLARKMKNSCKNLTLYP